MDQFIIDVLEWTCQDSSWRLVSSQGFPSVDNLMDTRSATALQSMEIASDTILSGKAKVMVAGGFDDLCEEGSYEFGNMKATSNSETELAMGREPTEMSRPTTTTRAGVRSLIILTEPLCANLITFQFMESQGVGVHIVMSAKTALELGCPIRGILAFTSTST